MKNIVLKMRDEKSSNCLLELIKYINQFSNTAEMDMIEIGSYAGESTEIFAKHFKNVISVDPFLNGYDLTDAACHHMDLTDVYFLFLEKIKTIDNITHLKYTSDEGFLKLNDRKFDFVYIDGLHTYEQVKKDILNFKQLIKSGGFIGGHDYHPGWDGVVKSVDETVGLDKLFDDGSWIKKL